VLAAAHAAEAEEPWWIDRAWETRAVWWTLAAAYVLAVTMNLAIARDGDVRRAPLPAKEAVVVDGLTLPTTDADSPVDAVALREVLDLPGRS